MSIYDNCQGYSNRETWLAAVWIANKLHFERHWRARLLELKNTERGEGLESLVQELKQEFALLKPELPEGLMAELLTIATCRIQWDEVAQKLWDDYQQEIDASYYVDQYSRAQAIEDGVLVDVTETAKEAGFNIPVAITHFAWVKAVIGSSKAVCQDEAGRLWDVLTVLFFSIKRMKKDRRSSTIRFTVSVRVDEHTNRDIRLKSICGPGDNAEPVLTIMLPDED